MTTTKYILFRLEIEHDEDVEIEKICKQFGVVSPDSESIYISKSDILEIMSADDLMED